MSNALLTANDLYKTFDEVKAVQGVSFEIREGEIYSLLGPNGSGKITTISVLSCLLSPTKGDGIIGGYSNSSHPPRCKVFNWDRSVRNCSLPHHYSAGKSFHLGKDVSSWRCSFK
jgi:ABC-type Na+ transport system ATPase subunit NatA